MYRAITEIESITEKLISQGKTDEQIKKVIKVYLSEFRNKINPDGKLDIK